MTELPKWFTERNPTGRIGPQGCSPLARPFRQRIQQANLDWRNIVHKAIVFAPGQEIQILPPNPSRGWMCIFCLINNTAGAALSSLRFAPIPGGTGSGSAFFELFAVPGAISSQTNILSYGLNGALATAPWFMAGLLDPAAGAQIDVWEQSYMG